MMPDVWGNAKPPNPFAKTAKTRKFYRISISVFCPEGTPLPFTVEHWPKGARYKMLPVRYGPMKYRRATALRFDNLCDMIVDCVGHEIFHYLAWTRQVPENTSDEVAAGRMGEQWVERFRQWKG
jgi:hypothetical protein